MVNMRFIKKIAIITITKTIRAIIKAIPKEIHIGAIIKYQGQLITPAICKITKIIVKNTGKLIVNLELPLGLIITLNLSFLFSIFNNVNAPKKDS